MFDDGFDTQVLKNHGDARICEVYRLVKELRLEGHDKFATLTAAERYNDTYNFPKLSEDELVELVDRLYVNKLTFQDIDRNKKVLELVKKFKNQGIKDETTLLEKVKLFNSNCNTPPLSDEELLWIITNMAYTSRNVPYWSIPGITVTTIQEKPKTTTKAYVQIGDSEDLRKI